MSDEPREREVERLLDGLRDPAARPEFRSSLRERFLAGAASAPPVDVMPDERVRSAPSAHSRSWKVWVALAAAAAIVAMLYLAKPAPRHWQLLPGSGAVAVRIDGERIPVADAERIATRLVDARAVTAEGGSLRLCFRDQYALELADGARVEFAAFGGTGGVDPYRLGASGPALRVVTGPGFPGHELHIGSGQASLHVTGTAFAVDNAPEGVCVCELQGHVGVLRKGTKEKDQLLEPGKSCWIPEDGGALAWGEAQPEHIGPLRELAAAVEGHWRP